MNAHATDSGALDVDGGSPRRWWIVALLFLIALVNNLDRQVLSVLAPTLRVHLHFSTAEYSYIVAAFLGAYTFGYAFCGPILDRWGARIGLAAALVFWSLADTSHALASGWLSLAVCRFFLGLGESFNSPGGLKAIAEWIPRRERAFSTALFTNGNIVGSIVAPPLVSFLVLTFNWQSPFLLTGFVGLILAFVWWRVYSTPDGPAGLVKPARAALAVPPEPAPRAAPTNTVWALWTNPLCLGFCAARFLTDATNYFFSFWIPDYLQQGRGFSLAMMGLFGWVPFLAADLGGLGGGAISDWLFRRGWRAIRARTCLMTIAALLTPLTLVAVRVPGNGLCLTLFAIVLAAQSCWMANQLTFISETFGRDRIGSVVAASACCGGLGGICANLLAGQLIAQHGYVPLFSLMGWTHLLGLAVLVYVFREKPESNSRPRAML